MIVQLIKKFRNNRRCNRIMKEYRLECQRKSLEPSYNQLDSYYKGNTLVVGCSCGNAKVTKEWDEDLGAYYYFYDCPKCNYYWEGPIYCGEEQNDFSPCDVASLYAEGHKFYELFNAGLISELKIDDCIELWHTSSSQETIYNYLGMTEEQYARWVETSFL